MSGDKQLLAEIAAHPRSALIEALADAMHEIEDDDGNGWHINYYRSLAYATVEILPALSYDEDALCDEPGCGAHPERSAARLPSPDVGTAEPVDLDDIGASVRDAGDLREVIADLLGAGFGFASVEDNDKAMEWALWAYRAGQAATSAGLDVAQRRLETMTAVAQSNKRHVAYNAQHIELVERERDVARAVLLDAADAGAGQDSGGLRECAAGRCSLAGMLRHAVEHGHDPGTPDEPERLRARLWDEIRDGEIARLVAERDQARHALKAMTADAGLSCGEQPHDPAGCHEDGRPHLGPCISTVTPGPEGTP